jgi:hypothetical protein
VKRSTDSRLVDCTRARRVRRRATSGTAALRGLPPGARRPHGLRCGILDADRGGGLAYLRPDRQRHGRGRPDVPLSRSRDGALRLRRRARGPLRAARADHPAVHLPGRPGRAARPCGVGGHLESNGGLRGHLHHRRRRRAREPVAPAGRGSHRSGRARQAGNRARVGLLQHRAVDRTGRRRRARQPGSGRSPTTPRG